MNDIRILIIGAGASGIAAASRLLESGINDLLILEAEDRIGGRVHTSEFGEGVVDLGGQWVHGEKDNVVFNMANPLNLLGETITELLDNTTLFIDSSGKVADLEVKAKIIALLSDIDEDSDKELKSFHGSLGEYITREFRRRLKEENILPQKDLPLAYYFLDWYEKIENSIDGSDSWFETSGQGLTEYWECEGNLLWSWKSGGYRRALDLLMRRYPDPKQELPVLKKTLFNKEVQKVVWDRDGKGKVAVNCSDGAVYKADHVIVTVSIGVLKERAHDMFSPALPEQKLVAVKGLSIGTVDKMFLMFPYRWWPVDCQGFNLLWTKEDQEEFTEINKMASRDKSWLRGVFGFYSVDNQPHVLCGWVTGPRARLMEQLTDSQVTEDLIELLNKFVGKMYTIPEPIKILRSSWTANPHFRGSYSFRSMDTERLGTNSSRLAEPIIDSRGKPVLLFAGEATHNHYFSTVHGAIETGWREANRLIKFFSFPHHEAVIVGAGIAGLAAAKTLLEEGIKDIIVLEAQNYIGGRVLSLPLCDGWVEAGAQWIHGSNNEIWSLADKATLLSDYTSSEGEGPYLREDGVELDPALVLEVCSVVSGILEECKKFNNSVCSHQEVPTSIGHYLRQKFVEYLDSCQTDTRERRDMKEELYDWHVRFLIIDNSCTVLDKLSAKAWGNYVFCGGTDYVNFKKGYSTLIQSITANFPPNTLRLNCPVKKIQWKSDSVDTNCNSAVLKNGFHKSVVNKESPVVITCQDGYQLGADHVIVTSSLGFLKENYRTMFEPKLPSSMAQCLQAIEDMGFSAINKIYLAFEEPWWSSDVKGFQLIWLKRNKDEASPSKPSSWTRDLTGFDVLPNHKAVLLGWVGGMGAKMIELLSEKKIGQHCTALLQKFTGQSDIPLPQSVVRTQWHNNPYVCGGYSNTTSMCDTSDVGPLTLADPLYVDTPTKQQQPVLLFAGEATHESFFSTTHGAFETGQRQANIITDYRKTLVCKAKSAS